MNQNRILRKSGWWILSILSILPFIFWLLGSDLAFKFSSSAMVARSLGDILGLCGMATFSLVMILSARLKFFESFFKGINESYTAHHVFGGLALCFLLFHPLFLVYNYLSASFMSAALFLLPGQSIAQNFGVAGLFVMIVTLAITFYTKLKYQIWKFTHKFLGVAFIFAFLHTFLIGADLLTNFSLKIYLFILGIGAIVTYFYRTLFADYMIRVFEYKIKNVEAFPDKIWEIEFEPFGAAQDRPNRVMSFAAGQFAFVKLHSKNLTKEPHPFSFSSAPGKTLKIAVKELGDYTNKIGNLTAGDSATLEGPFGAFNFRDYSNKKQVWIAGGIGITPFLSMARDLTAEDSDYKIDLYYSVKNENCLAFKEELEEISKKYKNLNVILWITEKRGFLTADSLENKDLEQNDFLICGPLPMMLALKKQLLDKGIKKNQIHVEEFQLY